MENKLVLQGKLEIKNAHIVIDGIDLANVLEHGSSVFMVVEPLPESKPEPEKNCGNCAIDYNRCTQHERKYGCDAWQPKAAEPKKCPNCGIKVPGAVIWIHKDGTCAECGKTVAREFRGRGRKDNGTPNR